MNYEESFLATCDDEGKAPAWAIEQIFEEHQADLVEYLGSVTVTSWNSGEVILNWLGY